MPVSKILLYYAFTPLADPDAVRLWQRDLCEALGLRGRIILSKDGINGTVGGELKAVKKYIRKTREYAPFANIDFKWSEGRGDDFPRLSVRVRDELVSFGAPGELRVDEHGRKLRRSLRHRRRRVGDRLLGGPPGDRRRPGQQDPGPPGVRGQQPAHRQPPEQHLRGVGNRHPRKQHRERLRRRSGAVRAH